MRRRCSQHRSRSCRQEPPGWTPRECSGVVDRQHRSTSPEIPPPARADLPDEHRLSRTDAHGSSSVGLQRDPDPAPAPEQRGQARSRSAHPPRRKPAGHTDASPLPALDRDEDRAIRRDIAVCLQLGHDRIGRRLQRLVAQLNSSSTTCASALHARTDRTHGRALLTVSSILGFASSVATPSGVCMA